MQQRVALKATTLRDSRSTTSCRSRTSCTHPPRQRNGWMTWHSERSLRRARWSTKRWMRLCSWCGTCRKTSWRSLQSQWLLQQHRALPNRLCQLLQDMTYTSRKPVKPMIWVWMCPVQESQRVEPWPRDGHGGETNENMREVWQVDLKASQCTAFENGSMGAESLGNGGCGNANDR